MRKRGARPRPHWQKRRGAQIPDLLRGQLAVSASDAAGAPLDATGVQLPGVIDECCATGAVRGLLAAPGAAAHRSTRNAEPSQTARLN
jgi:hypothetical protein